MIAGQWLFGSSSEVSGKKQGGGGALQLSAALHCSQLLISLFQGKHVLQRLPIMLEHASVMHRVFCNWLISLPVAPWPKEG